MKKVKKYSASHIKAFDCIIQAIKDCGYSIISQDQQTGTIRASSGFSLKSWGETILIQVSSLNNIVEVSVESTPKAQLMDWGKSRENVEVIIRAINKYLKTGE